MSKIVVLNSGGFDSVTLLHDLSVLQGEKEIYSLHFLYGARNEKQQLECVERVCKKLNVNSKVIQLPVIDWTHSNFFKDSEYTMQGQYLEYRNLIFLSYALSYAQAIGADRIYMAVLAGGTYSDTKQEFIEGVDKIAQQSGISIVTPYIDLVKDQLVYYAIQSKMTTDEYFSCDKPTADGKKCGECLDCKSLAVIDEVLEINHPFKALYQSGFDYSDKTFTEQLAKTPKDREVRALINNDCQLRCKHCFYGFDKMKRPLVDVDTYYGALKELVLEHGFTNIHFSGKEPLYDDKILEYAERIRQDNLPCTFDLVTNGINVPKYISRLAECGMRKLYVSIDSVLHSNGVRTGNSNAALSAIESCKECDIPVEVFIDLHENNWDKIKYIIKLLYGYTGVSDYYVRTIRSIGNAHEQTLLSGEQLFSVFKDLLELCGENKGINVSFNMSSEYVPVVAKVPEFCWYINVMDSMYTYKWFDNLSMSLERYCNRYGDITLTPDGYVLGCASEVAREDYDKFSAGNICDKPLKDILETGSKSRCEMATKFCDCNYSCMVNKF